MFKFLIEWITNLLAIEEKKTSTIVIVLFFFSIVAGWELKIYQEINDNLRIIIITCLLLIGGVNITGDIIPAIRKRDKDEI